MATIVFMGTPDFAVPALQALHTRFGVAAVVTVPDKPVGRGLTLRPSAVKQAAIELGITTILQPESLKDEVFQQQLAALQPDILCVIAFRILPRAVYGIARVGAFNVHASLLPKFRGAAPINHAIINGEKESGVTSFLLNDVVDTGNILLQERIGINDGTTAGELYTQLMPLAAQLAVTTTEGLLQQTLTPQQQNEELASPAPKVWRDECVIDWRKDADVVRNFILGVSPSPCAWTLLNNERIKIYKAEVSPAIMPDATWMMTDSEWIVGCGSASLSLTEIQMPGKPIVKVKDFLRGWRGDKTGVFEE